MTNNFENTRHNTEEVKNMTSVRKASELKSLDELNLSKRIYNCVKDIQPEELVFLVRTRKKIAGIGEKLSRKLETAMDQAGFIRHDFDGRSFGVALLYRLVENAYVISKAGWPYANYSNFESNEAYENYKNFSAAQLEAVDQSLDDTFSDEVRKRKKDILRLRLGLADGKRWNLTEVGAKYNCTRDRIRAIEARAIWKLRRRFSLRNRLRIIISFSSKKECCDQIVYMEQELSRLRRKERELEIEISNIKEYSPFFPEKGSPISVESDKSRSIADLDFGMVAYTILRRAGIATIGDLERYRSANPEDWYLRIQMRQNVYRSVNRSVTRELVEKTNRFLGWEYPLIDES